MRFCIALKREFWDSDPKVDWRGEVEKILGTKIEGNVRRVLVETTETLIQEIRSKIGQCCHVEEEITYTH